MKGVLAAHGIDVLIPIGGEGTLTAAHLLSRGRRPGRRHPEDDRQRHRRDRPDLRLRHRGQHRHRDDRPAAHDRRVAPAGAARRGHGPARRLDRAARRAGLRRAPDPGAGGALRRRRGLPAGHRPVRPGRLATSSASSPRAPPRCRAPCRCATAASTSSATAGSPGSPSSWARSWSGAPARRCGPRCSATSSAAARRPRSTACSPPGSGCTPRSPRTRAQHGQMVALRGTEIELVPLARAVARLKTVSPVAAGRDRRLHRLTPYAARG